MPPLPFKPTGYDLLDGLLVIATIVGSVAVGVWRVYTLLSASLTKTQADIQQVKHQVKNDHSTNLRDDLDGLADKLEALSKDADTRTAQMNKISTSIETLSATVQALHDKLDLSAKEHVHFRDEITRLGNAQTAVRVKLDEADKKTDAHMKKTAADHDRLIELEHKLSK